MNEKLNIQNLILLFAEKYDITPENAEEFVRTFFVLIEEGLEQDKYVKVKGLGTFKLIEVGSRESINVNTGERFEIQGHQKISFTPETALKELINRPFGHFETVVLNENVQFDDMPVEKEGEEEPEGEADEGMVIAKLQTMNRLGDPERMENVAAAEEEEVSQEEAGKEEPLVEESVSEESLSDYQRNEGDSRKMTRYIVAAIAGVFLGCVGIVSCLYCTFSEKNDERLICEAEIDATVVNMDTLTQTRKDSVVAVSDTVKDRLVDSVKIATEVQREKPAISQKRAGIVPEPFVPDSVSYEIVGTQTEYTVLEGQTLTRVSLKFYGTKALWPYLVKHNAGVLKNPNNVPSGTVIRIPKLAKKR